MEKRLMVPDLLDKPTVFALEIKNFSSSVLPYVICPGVIALFQDFPFVFVRITINKQLQKSEHFVGSGRSMVLPEGFFHEIVKFS